MCSVQADTGGRQFTLKDQLFHLPSKKNKTFLISLVGVYKFYYLQQLGRKIKGAMVCFLTALLTAIIFFLIHVNQHILICLIYINISSHWQKYVFYVLPSL